jgi:hypothetical protein
MRHYPLNQISLLFDFQLRVCRLFRWFQNKRRHHQPPLLSISLKQTTDSGCKPCRRFSTIFYLLYSIFSTTHFQIAPTPASLNFLFNAFNLTSNASARCFNAVHCASYSFFKSRLGWFTRGISLSVWLMRKR